MTDNITKKPPVGKPFQKGRSGNPGGRPKEIADLRELAREHTQEAVLTLVEVMRDQQAPHSARVRASDSLLDRGYGRPAQALEHSGLSGPTLQLVSASDKEIIEQYLSQGGVK